MSGPGRLQRAAALTGVGEKHLAIRADRGAKWKVGRRVLLVENRTLCEREFSEAATIPVDEVPLAIGRLFVGHADPAFIRVVRLKSNGILSSGDAHAARLFVDRHGRGVTFGRGDDVNKLPRVHRDGVGENGFELLSCGIANEQSQRADLKEFFVVRAVHPQLNATTDVEQIVQFQDALRHVARNRCTRIQLLLLLHILRR